MIDIICKEEFEKFKSDFYNKFKDTWHNPIVRECNGSRNTGWICAEQAMIDKMKCSGNCIHGVGEDWCGTENKNCVSKNCNKWELHQ
jgi:hypothetical protein